MIRYYLDGTEANPKDSQNIRFSLDFRNRRIRELEMSIDNLEFVNEDFTQIKEWLTTFGKGVGMPFDVQFSNGQTNQYILDFLDPSFRISERSVKAKAILRYGNDRFFKRAEGLAFGLIDWNDSDFTPIDYVVIPITKGGYLISLGIATYSLTQQLIVSVEQTVDQTTILIEAATPIGISPNWGAIITASLKLAAIIAYTLAITIALIKLATEIINLIFPKVRQFKGIKYKRLIEKGCEYLGYTFQSNFLDSLPNLSILPVPLVPSNQSFFDTIFIGNTLNFTRGYPTAKDAACSTLLRAIDQLENIFNLRSKVVNKKLIIEPEAYFIENATTEITRSFNLQDEINNEYGYNSEEYFKRKIVRFTDDVSDFNTLDDTTDSISEFDTSANLVPSPELELYSGYDEVLAGFARGTRKGDLNVFEKAARGLAKAIDAFGGTSLTSQINSRKNVLQISQLYFTVPKLLYLNGTKLDPNQNAYIGAKVIGDKYHNDKFIQNNSRKVYEAMPLELTEKELFEFVNNNFVILDNGKTAEILSVDWSEHEAQAIVDYDVLDDNINSITKEI